MTSTFSLEAAAAAAVVGAILMRMTAAHSLLQLKEVHRKCDSCTPHRRLVLRRRTLRHPSPLTGMAGSCDGSVDGGDGSAGGGVVVGNTCCHVAVGVGGGDDEAMPAVVVVVRSCCLDASGVGGGASSEGVAVQWGNRCCSSRPLPEGRTTTEGAVLL